MDYEETRKVLKRLKAVYPSAIRKLTTEDMQAMLDEWAEAFKADSAGTVNEAVTRHTSVVPFLPSISDIRALMPKRVETDESLRDIHIGNLRASIAVLQGCIRNSDRPGLRDKLAARQAELTRMTI